MPEARRIFLITLFIVGAGALQLPDYITPCSRKDPKFNECALKSGREAYPRIVKGDRTFGVPVLDPLYVEKLSMEHAGIQATSINFTIIGMKDAVLKDFSVDFDSQVIKISFWTPRVTLTGKYDVRGKILGLSLYGQGDYQLVFIGLRGNYTATYQLSQLQDGELHLVPQNYDVEFDVEDVKINFENLFNGNKFLSDSMNQVMNENWRLVMDDVGKPIFTALGSIIHHILTSVSQKISYNELFDN